MKKFSIQKLFIIILLVSSLLSSCSSGEYKPAEYINATSVAVLGQETKVELDDGAAIIIPANATDSDVTVTIERNPEKSKALPPLGDDVVQLGNFYNFNISGGTLIDGFDLVLPFDQSRIPNKDGMLVIAIPSENGWEFVPVEAEGNKVTFYTSNVGDPLIAWHFVPIDGRIDLNHETKEELAVCDERIQLDLSPADGPIGTEIKISGQVLPVRKGIANWQENWDNLLKFNTAANVPVNIYFGSSYVGNGYGANNVFDTIAVNTNQDGSFEATYVINHEGYGVHVTAKAQCDKWFGTMPVPSEGRVYFRLTKSTVENPALTPTTESSVVEPTETPIPTGAVLLPDFVGQDIDNAINWLEQNGFKYSWIDGSSTYELGMVYNQAPAGGQYKVPHRTVVVIYRTIEKISDPCIILNLTSEECVNYGKHEYTLTSCSRITQSSSSGFYTCGCPENNISRIYEFNFLGSGELQGVATSTTTQEWDNIGLNTYFSTSSYKDEDDEIKSEDTFIFTENGFSILGVSTHLCIGCVSGTRDDILVCENQYEYMIVK